MSENQFEEITDVLAEVILYRMGRSGTSDKSQRFVSAHNEGLRGYRWFAQTGWAARQPLMRTTTHVGLAPPWETAVKSVAKTPRLWEFGPAVLDPIVRKRPDRPQQLPVDLRLT